MNLTKILFSIIAITIVACNNGGVNNQQQLPTNIFINDPIPPSPFPPQGKYNGQLYSLLKTPPGLGLYPNSYLPNTPQSNALNIAYGGNTESQISDMTALVLINKDGKHFNYLCSATPVSYDSKTNTTFLIGAAHCFVNNKDNLNILTKNNLIPAEHLQIHNGINKDGSTGYAVKAVYLMQNYCYGNTFPEGGACSNFTPSDGAKNGQGNDLAIVQISGKYANPDNYPHIVKSIE